MKLVSQVLNRLLASNADSVQLLPGSPPYLYRGNQAEDSGLDPVTDGSIESLGRLLLEYADPSEFRATGKARGAYPHPKLGTFEFGIRRINDGIAVAFRRREPDDTQTTETAPAHELAVDTREFTVRERSFRGLLRAVLEFQVSDLVVTQGRPARVRLGGRYLPIEWAVFTEADLRHALGDLLTTEREEELTKFGSLDLGVEVADTDGKLRRFRVNIFKHLEGLATAWRPIWDSVPDFSALLLPEDLINLAELPYGLVLVTGPTGSGKSTTLSALIEHINQTSQKHIITLEDPIEYRFRDKLSVVHQREVGVHTDSFSKGLRSALREAPDVILVGEMRDLDTISAALTAAETGHLVLSTLHSGHSAQAIDRIIDVFPENQQQQVRVQLADVLRAIVTQRLLPTTDGVNRVPAVEIVRVTYAVSNTIREGRTHQLTSLIQSGQKDGMLPFDASLARLVVGGLIDDKTAELAARDKTYLKAQIKHQTPDATDTPPR